MLRDRVEKFIHEHQLFIADEPVVVGVSGGLDSVVLLDVLHRLGQALVITHVHHGLRGGAADTDEAFVRELAEQRNLPFEVERADVRGVAEREGRSLEETARAVRYRLLHDVADRVGSAVVAVAHHRDDQAETVLLNLFRGAGLEGLAGMAPSRQLRERSEIRLVRPLLDLGREELEVYARSRDLEWRLDATNSDVTFRRNALRHELMPLVREHFGAAAPAKVAEAAAVVRGYLEEQWRAELERRFAQCLCADQQNGLGLKALAQQPGVWRGRIVLEALKQWLPDAPQRSSVVTEVIRLLDAQPGRRVELEAGDVWRERDVLRFASKDESRATMSCQLRVGSAVEVAESVVRAGRPEPVPTDLAAGAPNTVYVDAAKLAWPLTVRIWEAGDRIQPLGMDGSRLVSDVLTDAHVPPSERTRRLVVLAGEDVCWVVGHRLGHAFRVTEGTQQVIRLCCEHAA